jgi:hypothetical protein
MAEQKCMAHHEMETFYKQIEKSLLSIEKKYDDTKRFYQRVLLACIVVIILAVGDSARSRYRTDIVESKIDVLEKESITYEQFILFNRSWELQFAHYRAITNGNDTEVVEHEKKYNELRSLIATMRVRGQVLD